MIVSQISSITTARPPRRVGLVDRITATRMTQHQLPVALRAPLRVVLYENEADHAVLEYDRPTTLFGQFGDERVMAVARKLDASLERVLARAAG